jgi:hypothetical protein
MHATQRLLLRQRLDARPVPDITITEMVREVERELTLRRRVYPGWVAAKRMTKNNADRQIAVMEAVSRELQKRMES